MWVWNPTSEQLIEVASQLITTPPRYEDWKSDTENCRNNISLRCMPSGGAVDAARTVTNLVGTPKPYTSNFTISTVGTKTSGL